MGAGDTLVAFVLVPGPEGIRELGTVEEDPGGCSINSVWRGYEIRGRFWGGVAIEQQQRRWVPFAHWLRGGTVTNLSV
jgi:hypothetical protein